MMRKTHHEKCLARAPISERSEHTARVAAKTRMTQAESESRGDIERAITTAPIPSRSTVVRCQVNLNVWWAKAVLPILCYSAPVGDNRADPGVELFVIGHHRPPIDLVAFNSKPAARLVSSPYESLWTRIFQAAPNRDLHPRSAVRTTCALRTGFSVPADPG